MSFYAIVKGRVTGIVKSWIRCQMYTGGYSNAMFKRFDTKEEAEKYLLENAEVIEEEPPPVEEPPPPVEEPQPDPCTSEQREAIDAVHAGETIFLTGPGGTGKSFLLNVLYNEFTKSGKKMAVTAMTGCAALLLGPHAKTLHSWAGIGLGRESSESIISAIVRNGKKKKNWKVDCLVIDEVSMLTPDILQLLDTVGRAVRKNRNTPMGGLQIVFVGDFYQLPPVADTAKFVFQSDLWKNIVKKTVQLKTIHRQRDPAFQKVLMEARVGELSDESYDVLMSRKGLRWKGLEIRPTLLFTRNADVNTINTKELGKLPGDAVVYRVSTASERDYDESLGKKGYEESSPSIPDPSDYRIQKLDKDASYVTDLQLKIGAQVMLITNITEEDGLVNGSRGVVLGFGPSGPSVKFLSRSQPYTVKLKIWKSGDDEPVFRCQMPLRLAYALTIHKAQGASLDSAMVDIGPATFEYGQAYVALSRVRSLEALYVYDLDKTAFKVHPAVKEFYEDTVSESEDKTKI